MAMLLGVEELASVLFLLEKVNARRFNTGWGHHRRPATG
jgi:hypothetical protein